MIERQGEIGAQMIGLLWSLRNDHDPEIRARVRYEIAEWVRILRRERPDIHTHKCGHTDIYESALTGLEPEDGCGHTWKHNGKDAESDCDNYRMHRCPKCGKGPWYLKYRRADGSYVKF
jgi:hypothetical protein